MTIYKETKLTMNEPTNFRDLGGLAGHDGKKIKPKSLLRSAALTNPPPQGYKISQVIDLRTGKEAQKKPYILPPGANYIRVDIPMDGSVKGAGIGSLVVRGKVEGCRDYLLKVYAGFVTSETACKGFAGFLSACAHNLCGAVLFHCVAGKDRTGFAGAILLKILGVSQEDIMTDYLKTETLRQQANSNFIAYYRRRGLFFKKQQEALAVIMGVMPEYLLTAFETIDSTYGSFDGYLAQGLGITQPVVNRLRELYLE